MHTLHTHTTTTTTSTTTSTTTHTTTTHNHNHNTHTHTLVAGCSGLLRHSLLDFIVRETQQTCSSKHMWAPSFLIKIHPVLVFKPSFYHGEKRALAFWNASFSWPLWLVEWFFFIHFFFVCKSQLNHVHIIFLVSSDEIIQILAELSSVQHRKLMIIGDCTNQYVGDHIVEIVCGISLTWLYHGGFVHGYVSHNQMVTIMNYEPIFLWTIMNQNLNHY